MAGIRTSINLIDNMSRVLDRITGSNDKMKNSIENSQNTMDKSTKFAENMSRDEQRITLLSQQYQHQANEVQKLANLYQREAKAVQYLDQIYKKHHDTTAIGAFMAKKELEYRTKSLDKYRNELSKAQMKELNLADAVEKAGKALERKEEAENKIGNGIKNAINNQRQFNNELNNGSSAADDLVNKVKGFIGAYLGIRGIKKGFESTIGAAAELNQQAAVMQAAFGDKDVGKQYFNKLQMFAIDSRKDMEELTDVTKNFMQLTRNTDKLMGLTKSANKLAMRTGSIGSAESLMQEAMRGEFSRLQRTLHFTDAKIAPLKKAVQKGSLDGIIGAFDEALTTAGLTDDIAEAFENSPLQKFYKIFDNAKKNFAGSGEEALERLKPVLERINEWLTSSDATMYFNMLGVGIAWIVDGVMGLGGIIGSVMGFAEDNIGALLPVILGVAGALMLWNAIQWGVTFGMGALTMAQKLYAIKTSEATLMTKLFNFALAMNPVTMVVMALLGLIVALAVFGNSTKSVRQIFSDAFGFIVDTAENATNSVIGFVNWMIKNLNKVADFFGVGQITEIEYKASFSKVKEFGQDFIENVTIDSLKAKYGLDSTTEAINNFADQENMWNGAQQDTLGKLDDTGKKIKKSVDKSNEDLKWMRDMAEQEVINRFTTATMAPQISIEFGDVRETADIDGIIEKLEVILEEQINISAEGVHK